jgi:hypothetical protein
MMSTYELAIAFLTSPNEPSKKTPVDSEALAATETEL